MSTTERWVIERRDYLGKGKWDLWELSNAYTEAGDPIEEDEAKAVAAYFNSKEPGSQYQAVKYDPARYGLPLTTDARQP